MGSGRCPLRKLSSGDICSLVSSSMGNTAKPFGNTDTSVLPLQTRRRGGKMEWMQVMQVQAYNSSTREAEPVGSPQVQGQPGLQNKTL